jgi:hypothetical protein
VSDTNVLVTAATTTGGVEFLWQAIGGSAWTERTVATSGGPFTSPQIAWTGPVHGGPASYDAITAATTAGTLDYWWTPDGSLTAWNPETVATKGKQAFYANPGFSVTTSSVVITAINTKPGDVIYWHQAFGTKPWPKEVVATG